VTVAIVEKAILLWNKRFLLARTPKESIMTGFFDTICVDGVAVGGTGDGLLVRKNCALFARMT